jgi:hypothetical protein
MIDFYHLFTTGFSIKGLHRAVGKKTGETNPIERLNDNFQ